MGGEGTGQGDALTLAREIVARMSDPAVLLGPDLTAISFNALYIQLTGFRPSALSKMLGAGASVFDIVAHSEEDRVNALQAMELKQTVALTELTVKNAAGTSFVVLQTFIPVVDGTGTCIGLILSYRDLSAEARIQSRYKDLIAREKARAEELECQVEERTRQLRAALEEVTRLSRTDPLTSLLNRRAFTDYFEHSLQLAQRYERSAAILMCDLDHFKRLNDQHGHQAGDAMLVAVAKTLTRTVRQMDKVARFGGEEFVVLLTETSPESVTEVAQRCCQAVRELPYAEIIPGAEGRQTISIGVALFPEHGASQDEMVGAADEALYQAKESGRDRAVLFRKGEETKAVPQPSERLRVLLLEPDAQEAARLQRILESTYEVLSVASAEEGMALCGRNPFEAIIAAEGGEGTRGQELLDRSMSVLPGALRILILESEAFFAAIRGFNAAQIDQFLLRSDCADHLLSAVESALLRHELFRRRVVADANRKDPIRSGHFESLTTIIREQQLQLAYQPIIEAADGKVVAFEALTRVSPERFTGVEQVFETAFQSGLLWELGRLVRHSVSRDLERLAAPTMIFINLHPLELSDEQLLAGEPCLLAHSRRIIFEITERAAIPDLSRFRESVQILRRHGFRLAIDDLGAGYASLNSVALLEPDFIKIDRTLIQDAPTSPRRQSIIRSIVDFCNRERIQVIAEGIETAAEKAIAVQLGCHYLQGFLLGRPEPLEPATVASRPEGPQPELAPAPALVSAAPSTRSVRALPPPPPEPKSPPAIRSVSAPPPPPEPKSPPAIRFVGSPGKPASGAPAEKASPPTTSASKPPPVKPPRSPKPDAK